MVRLRNAIDMRVACEAPLGRPAEGVNRLMVEVRPGGGANTDGLVDAIRANNMYATNIGVSCSNGKYYGTLLHA